jgi:hypothetical protein
LTVNELNPNEFEINLKSVIPKAELFLKNGGQIKLRSFIFSDESFKIIDLKNKGAYTAPQYEKIKLSTISVKDLFD